MSIHPEGAGSEMEQMMIELSHVMGMWTKILSDFERQLWRTVMQSTSLEKFRRALQAYIFSPEAKFGPPQPGQIAAYVGLTVDPAAAYAQLEAAVRDFGPYQVPPVTDAVLLQAIHNMGGWAAVNASMPAPSQAYETKQFRDRFQGCLISAINQVRVDGQKVDPLLPIGGASAVASIATSAVATKAIPADAFGAPAGRFQGIPRG